MSEAEAEAHNREALKKRIDRIRERYQPTDFVQPDCHPSLHVEPLLAYYGVAVTREEILDYATSLKLHFPPIYEGKCQVVRNLWAFEAAVKHMSKKFNFRLHLRMPLNVDYQWNVALYSNYVVAQGRLIREDEARLTQMIREEMGLPRDRKALWHYDSEEGTILMRTWIWKLPSKETQEEIRKAYAKLGVTLGPFTPNQTEILVSGMRIPGIKLSKRSNGVRDYGSTYTIQQ